MSDARRLRWNLVVRCLVAAAMLCGGASGARGQSVAAEPDGSDGVVELPAVVVTGTGFEQLLFDTPASLHIVDAQTLRASGPRVDLSEALARVPGLTVNHRHNYAQDLQISSRGFGARATFGVRGLRLYTDGIPASMPDGQGQVSHFDLANAERIEVLRGPFSALYGNSSGGVIQVVSAPVRERRAEITLDAGSFGTGQGLARARGAALADTGAGLGPASRRQLLHDRRASARTARPTARAANVRLGWSGERDTLSIAYGHFDQPSDDPLGLTRALFEDDPDQVVPQARLFRTRKVARQDQIGLTWRRDFPAGTALDESALTAYYGRRSVTQWQSIPVAVQTPPTHPGGVIDFDRDYFGIDARTVWRWTLAGGP